MIKINTKTDVSAGTWKEFRPGVRVKLRPCTRRDYRLAVKEEAERSVDQVLLHWSIMEWDGVVDQDGAPLPCTPAMIDTVVDVVPDLANWVVIESGKILSGLLISEEEELKN